MAQTEHNPVVDGFMFLPYYDREKLENRAADNFKFRPGDVVVSSLPKSGNVWTTEVLKAMYGDWGLQKFGDTAAAMVLDERTVFKKTLSKTRQRIVDAISAEDLPSPRLIRTHLPATIFPCHVLKSNDVKVVHVTRNPKDNLVSWYHFLKTFAYGALTTGDWERTVLDFLDDKLPFTPWTQYVAGWIKLGTDDNVLHVSYEEMKEDLPRVVKKIAVFLQRPLTEGDIEIVVNTTTVEAMRNRLSQMIITDDEFVPKGENPYVRKGIVGDWKNHFTVAQNELFDSIIGEKVNSISPNIPYQ
ncbi:sulfotransferase 1B1-like [Ptychodera flava]|uniref:sulfotransferase 1B1-like n=1 Tax=Ptychodera flava TaxID=63121 RepID=UPI00396A1AE7